MIPFDPSGHKRESRWRKFPGLGLALPISLMIQGVEAQDLVAPVVNPPTGFSEVPLAVLPDGGDLLEGLTLALSSGVTYDSNLFLGSGGLGSPIEDDLIFSIAPGMIYRTQGNSWSVGLRGGLNHTSFSTHRDLGGLGYDAGADLAFAGGPLSLSGAFNYVLDRGANRNFGGSFVEVGMTSGSLRADYKVSPKTSIDARLTHRLSLPNENFGSTVGTNFGITARWKASPLMSVAPGIAWGWQSGDRQVTRETIGPLLRLTYNLGRKVALDGSFGMDFAEFDGQGQADIAFTQQLGLNYRASSLWRMNFSLSQGTEADGANAGRFRETIAWRIAVNRRIRRATLGLGLGYDANRLVDATGSGAPGSRDSLSLDGSLSMPIFWRRAQASTFVSWRQESGAREWDGFRLGLSISSSF